MRRRELDLAHELFDESLRLDIAAALPHFERSLAARVEGGAQDASMFAAITLANALVELGRVEEALPHLDYAMQVAKQIPSHAGRSRTKAVQANINQKALR